MFLARSRIEENSFLQIIPATLLFLSVFLLLQQPDVGQTILIIITVIFSYGLIRGIYDANFNAKSSILSIGLTVNAMNPLSAFGYRLGIHTNPEIQKRIDSLKENLDSFNDDYE